MHLSGIAARRGRPQGVPLLNVEETALLFSSLGLALYSGIRLGYFAPESIIALEDVMGPVSRAEKLLLLLSPAVLLLIFLWSLR